MFLALCLLLHVQASTLPPALVEDLQPPTTLDFFAGVRSRSGALYAGAEGAIVYRYDGQQWDIIRQNRFARAAPVSMQEDPLGRIWMSSWGHGQFFWNGGSWTQRNTQGGGHGQELVFLDSSTYYTTGIQGLAGTVQGNSWTLDERLGHDFLQCLVQDPTGNLYTAGNYGAFWRKDTSWQRLDLNAAFTVKKMVALGTDDIVLCGAWWVERGRVMRYANGALTDITPPGADVLYTMAEGPGGTLWVAGIKGGLHWSDNRGSTWHAIDIGVDALLHVVAPIGPREAYVLGGAATALRVSFNDPTPTASPTPMATPSLPPTSTPSPSPPPTASPSPTESPSPTPAATSTPAPIPTPTPARKAAPRVLLAGYGLVDLSSSAGGMLDLYVLAEDASEVRSTATDSLALQGGLWRLPAPLDLPPGILPETISCS